MFYKERAQGGYKSLGIEMDYLWDEKPQLHKRILQDWLISLSYILHVRHFAAKHNYSPANIIAMDDRAVWLDMVSDTTVGKTGVCTVIMKSTGHEKCWVSVCLTVKADRSKLRPLIVFKYAKREIKTFNDEFKTWCVIVTSSNG